MFKLPIFILCILLSASAYSQVHAPISDITVFLNGAQINRAGIVTVKSGQQSIKLKNLSPYINPNTIQANLSDVKILEVNYTRNYLNTSNDNVELLELKNSLNTIIQEIKKENIKQETVQAQLNFIFANQSLKGTETTDLLDIKDYLSYYNNKIPELKTKILESENQIEKFNIVKSKIEKQIKEVQSVKNEYLGEIELVVFSATNQTIPLKINYHTGNCGWTPIYSIRAKDLSSPVQLEYAANVYQNTGVSWEKVKFILATGNPVLSGSQPSLAPWVLRNQNYRKTAITYAYAADEDAGMALEKEVRSKVGYNRNAPAASSENITFSEFQIIQSYSIKSGASSTRMFINKYELPADYTYYSAPKVNNNVYLLANVSGWENLSLMAGKANIYFDNTYVGNSYIDPSTNDDTLAVSLGQDQNITVKREKIANKCISKSFGLSKKHVRAYQIEIKNNRKEKIRIKIVDQLPLSSDEKIKVETVNIGDAKYDASTGLLEWNYDVINGELITTSFEFEVKHPKKMRVAL